MYRKSRLDTEIERRIAERDRLLLSAQKSGDHEATGDSRESRRVAARLHRLEGALARFLDPDWLANASREELLAHATAALDSAQDEEDPGEVADDYSAA